MSPRSSAFEKSLTQWGSGRTDPRPGSTRPRLGEPALLQLGPFAKEMVSAGLVLKKVSQEQRARVNTRTGWSSIAFGATPRWPCLESKKPTPVIVAGPWRRAK